jgi:hypothetical protein
MHFSSSQNTSKFGGFNLPYKPLVISEFWKMILELSDQSNVKNVITGMFIINIAVVPMLHGSLSAQHGTSSSCRWRRQPPDIECSCDILNMQSWTAYKECSSSLGVRQGANNSSL